MQHLLRGVVVVGCMSTPNNKKIICVLEHAELVEFMKLQDSIQLDTQTMTYARIVKVTHGIVELANFFLKLEQRYGFDLSDVTIHKNGEVRSN